MKTQRNLERNLALDVVKGICVFGMVVHHSIEYFPTEALQLKYFRFISGAFLFMAGFVSTSIYFSRFDPSSQSNRIAARLIYRGIRILIILALINMTMLMVPGISEKAGRLSPAMYAYTFFWAGTYRDVSFALLVPIGYVLIVVGLCALALKSRVRLLPYGAAGIFCYCWANHFSQETGYYLRYFSIGFVGAACGLLPIERINRVCENLGAISLAFLALLFAIAYLPFNYPFYTLSVVVSLMFLYAMGMKMPLSDWAVQKAVFIGNYTLIAYLAQILILRAVSVLTREQSHPEWRTVEAMVATTLIMTAFVWVLDTLRKKVKAVDDLYRAVFA